MAHVRILYIGNSFTARNDLPGMIARMAASQGVEVEHQLISAGGASLRMHWNKGEAQRAIEAGKFDYVVLQEQSTLPIKNATRFHENVRMVDPVIRAAGAQTVLYMTWARQFAPETQEPLSAAYEQIGEELGAIVVPVGRVWQAVQGLVGAPNLYDQDGSHPSPAGSYLAACVFLQSLLKLNPIGSAVSGNQVDERVRRLLEEAVYQGCS